MASKARKAFDDNAADIERLLELHKLIGGDGKGRREGLEVLNKSAIVLITSFWEAYCEDLAAEALNHLVKHATTAERLPEPLRKKLAKEVKSNINELAVWQLADSGWKKYLTDRFEKLREERNRKLNTPKSEPIDELFLHTVGIASVSDSWKWAKKMTVERARAKLDKFVELRGAIAHRGQASARVQKNQVEDYFDFTKRLVAKTGGKINTAVRSAVGEPLWKDLED
jgi:RiboL-PSP-HEPN